MTTIEKIAIMQAYVDGKQIQIRESEEWIDFYIAGEPSWNWQDYEYRIKPEPKEPTYRPYRNFAEFRKEWIKHDGWAIDKRSGMRILISFFVIVESEDLATNFTWEDDGTPCGIKEE